MTDHRLYVPVAVVIPCYCCEATVERAVASVANQTRLPTEVWLVDDASPDCGKTLAKLIELKEKYRNKLKIEVLRLDTNGGPSAARNAGWNSATQPYIAFLDADDSWNERKLEIQYGWMAEHPEVALTGHRSRVAVNARQAMTELCQYTPTVYQVSPISLLLSNRFSTPSVMLKRELPFRFDPSKRRSEDYLLWLSICLAGHKCFVIDLPLTYSYKALYGESGLSASLWEMELAEIDTFIRLWRQGYLNLPLLLGAIAFSFAKHIRRVLLTLISRWTHSSQR